MRKEDYLYKDRYYTIRYLTDAEFKERINTTSMLKRYSAFRLSLTRGFSIVYSSTKYYIYIKDSAKIGREKLIKHEIGHVMGKKHTWLPTLMNPTWVFRWIDWM